MKLSKRPWFSGGQRAGLKGQSQPGQQEQANQRAPAAGAQRGSADPVASKPEFDVLSENGEAPRRRILSPFVTLAALAVFGGVAWYVYNWGANQFEIVRQPINLADAVPIGPHLEIPAGIEPSPQDVAVLNDAAPVETVVKMAELPERPPETAVDPRLRPRPCRQSRPAISRSRLPHSGPGTAQSRLGSA